MAAVTEIVVALPPGVAAPAGTIGVPGGQRSARTRCAPRWRPRRRDDVVVVHDAARPLVTPELVAACLDALGDADAAIAAAPVTDTIKECADGRVVRTLDRSRLWAVQTPQVFRRAALRARAGRRTTTWSAPPPTTPRWSRRWAATVRIVPAPPENLKVTTALDLRVAEMLLRER